MLGEMRKTISMADLAKNPEGVARDIDASGAVYCIKRPGRPQMLMMDAEYFEGQQAIMRLMQDPHWGPRMQQAQRDFEAGRGITLDELEAELGLDRPPRSRRRGSTSRNAGAGRTKGSPRTPRSRGRAT
jgi:hypothetical protein